jgi:glycosyltransferase involved in cell wall biosynthesis
MSMQPAEQSSLKLPLSTGTNLSASLVDNFIVYLLPLTAALGPYLLPLHVLGINAYAFRLLVICACLYVVVTTVHRRSSRLTRWSGLYALLGAVWILWGVAAHLWAAKTSHLFDLLDVILGFAAAVPIVLLSDGNADARLHSLRLGWVSAYVVDAVVAVWELASNHHLPGYYASHASPWKLHHVVMATFENPNNYSAFVTLSLPFLWWSFVLASGIRKYVYGFWFLTIPALLALTAGRLGILGVGIELILLVVIYVRSLRSMLAAAGGLLSMYVIFRLCLLFSASDQEKITHSFSTPAFAGHEPLGSIGERINLVRNGLHFVRLSHGLGFGPGSFEYLMSHGFGIYPTGGIINPHNFWIEVLVEYGVIVFLGLVFCLTAVALAAFRHLRHQLASTSNTQTASAAVVVGLSGYLFAAVEHSSYINQPVNWVFLASMVGIVSALYAAPSHRAQQETRTLPKVIHLTSVHSPTDTRIFIKECRTLSRAGYDVGYIVPGRAASERIDGVRIIAISDWETNRLMRMTVRTCRVFLRCLREKADIYHFHDPELIPVGLLLKRLGKTVIYDVHEDVPEQIRSRHWLPDKWKKPVSSLVAALERIAARRMDAVVTATPFLEERLRGVSREIVTVRNYPIVDELMVERDGSNAVMTHKPVVVTYVGDLTEPRGVFEMVEAIDIVNQQREATLNLGGNFSHAELRQRLEQLSGWRHVQYLGWLERPQVRATLGRSDIGLVLIHPEPRYTLAYPVKLFEYMAAGLPVIGSNFPVWREIIEGNQCGICVEPLQPGEIAEAIRWLMDHPDEAREMGKNGQKAVKDKYSWDSEAQTLLALYRRVTPSSVRQFGVRTVGGGASESLQPIRAAKG